MHLTTHSKRVHGTRVNQHSKRKKMLKEILAMLEIHKLAIQWTICRNALFLQTSHSMLFVHIKSHWSFNK
jgi:hypothetical protein